MNDREPACPVSMNHRTSSYTPNGETSGSNGSSNGGAKEHRKLLVKIGDMVQVIDPKSHLNGKYGLVAEIHPRNLQYQVLVRIGKVNNPLKFFQIRFCSRIDPVSNGNFKKDSATFETEEEIETNKVSDFIDEIDESEDNKGNRAGANEMHGKKL